jgi:DNA-binding transcriptional ArsR family regulator
VGELVAGKPALRLSFVVSLPIDLVSAMSLLYRAVPGNGLDPWLIQLRRSLPPQIRAELDLLHGFSGRMLYYMEEPVMRFDPLRPDRLDATFEELIDFLESLPADEYLEMVAHSAGRVHQDIGLAPMQRPAMDDLEGWRTYLTPGQTTADMDEVLSLISDPETLKRRTIGLIEGVWEHGYGDEFYARFETLSQAARLASGTEARGAALAFSELTGNRMPSTLAAWLPEVERVTFCPSLHVGSLISYVFFPPDLVIFFNAGDYLLRNQINEPARHTNGSHAQSTTNGSVAQLVSPETSASLMAQEPLLEALRALGDQNRLHILELLSEGELYAQEIVGRLGIAQSAVSRHLSLLERAGLVKVRPRGGMKYYAVEETQLKSVAGSLCRLGRNQN